MKLGFLTAIVPDLSLEEIVAFLAMDSQQDAERVLRRIEARATTLESSPARGRVVPELARFQMRTWRELMIRPYRLVYRKGLKLAEAIAEIEKLAGSQPELVVFLESLRASERGIIR